MANAAQRRPVPRGPIGWRTTTGTVAQVEYGTTANYGAFTLLKILPAPPQEMLLTGLRPATSTTSASKPGMARRSRRVGRLRVQDRGQRPRDADRGCRQIQPQRVSLSADRQRATSTRPCKAARPAWSGCTSMRARARVSFASRCTRMQAGRPGTILAQGSAPGLTPVGSASAFRRSHWSRAGVTGSAVLSPIGGGQHRAARRRRGGSSLLSRQTTLAAFPLAWTSSAIGWPGRRCRQTSSSAPSADAHGAGEGAIVTGSVPLSAVVDDDVP